MARYAETLLSDGERIALRARQHWLATIIDGRVAWALFVASLVLLVLRLQMSGGGALEQVLGYLVLVLLVVSVVMLGYRYWSWYSQDYLVTNRRVLKVEGIFNKRSADSSLEKINDAVLEQNLAGRIFGYGDLDIMTASEESVDRYRMLDQAPRFKKVMLDEKHRLEADMVRLPSPPARAGAAGPRVMTMDELTRALDELAALRDRGAISTADFEAKKQELLGRI
ncbi:MAG: PH domain-containing protein [Candidatus Limnocylindrales bacterium]